MANGGQCGVKSNDVILKSITGNPQFFPTELEQGKILPRAFVNVYPVEPHALAGHSSPLELPPRLTI